MNDRFAESILADLLELREVGNIFGVKIVTNRFLPKDKILVLDADGHISEIIEIIGE